MDITVEANCTVHGLKEAIQDEIGETPEEQELFFLGYPLTDAEHELKDLLPMSTTFNLALKTKATKQFYSDQQLFLIIGPEWKFRAIQIQAEQEEAIELRSNNKFGLVQHTESDEPGKRIFHARLYEANREGRIEYRTGNVFTHIFA